MNSIIYVPPPYPIASFPVIIRETALEIQRNIQAPDAMIAMALEAAMSLACQGLVDVKLPTGQIRPCSLNLLCIGESGERKSTVDALVFNPVYESDTAAAIAYVAALNEGDIAGEGTTMSNRKEPPRLRRFIRQNITPRAIMDSLNGDGESIAIATDEGHVLFRSDTMSNLGMLNKCWDGAPLLTLDRADLDHLLVMNPRVTVSIMTQMEPLQKFMQTRGALGRSSGHFARYLVGHPISTQGYRWTGTTELIWEHLSKFKAITKDFLARYVAMINSGPVTRDIVEFSPDAKARWFALASETEWLLRPGQYLSDINDFASKTMEIVGRVAAIFHYFSGETGQITLDTLERAFTVVKWHVEEYKRLFAPQASVCQDLVDSQALVLFLRYHVWRGAGSNSLVAKNWLLQYGPVRQRDRLNAALHLLFCYQAVTIGVAVKGKQKFVNLLDPYFEQI